MAVGRPRQRAHRADARRASATTSAPVSTSRTSTRPLAPTQASVCGAPGRHAGATGPHGLGQDARPRPVAGDDRERVVAAIGDPVAVGRPGRVAHRPARGDRPRHAPVGRHRAQLAPAPRGDVEARAATTSPPSTARAAAASRRRARSTSHAPRRRAAAPPAAPRATTARAGARDASTEDVAHPPRRLRRHRDRRRDAAPTASASANTLPRRPTALRGGARDGRRPAAPRRAPERPTASGSGARSRRSRSGRSPLDRLLQPVEPAPQPRVDRPARQPERRGDLARA